MNISGMLREVLRVRRLTARDSYGDPTRNEPHTYRARIERGQGRVFVRRVGKELDLTAMVWTIEEILLSDLLYFPEDDTTNVDTARKPTKVEKMIGTNGLFSHWETTI